jgi:glycosyltransferase involved in cell wall biosynthesis
MQKLSVVLATFNEEKNLSDCLESIKDIADEIIIVDGSSSDKTIEIAKKFNAKIIITDNPPIFHINKQKALDLAKNEWILQLDADERVSHPLKEEIIKILSLTEKELEEYQAKLTSHKLFKKHQKIIERRDGKIGTQGPYVAFFIPRLNYFLGKYLRYGGVYPDGVIRLVKKSKAHFPCVSVHEQIAIDGKVGWLQNPLYHIDSPTFKRYLQRNQIYIDLITQELKADNLKPTIINSTKYLLVLPLHWFTLTFIRHKGFLDSWQGLIFSLFSSLRFPRAYLKYLKKIRE